MHPRIPVELRAPPVDADKETDDRVQRVTPFLRGGPRMRSDAGEGDALSDDAEARAAYGPLALPGGMRRERREDPVEDAFA